MSNKNMKNSNRKKKEKLKVSSIDLNEQRIIYLDGDIDDKVARETVELLLKMDMVNNKDITMYINSPGGSISAGFCIYDAMNLIKSDVRTICIGRAASMGCILLINGAKGKRYCTQHSEVMLHEVSGGAFGKVSEVENHLEHSKNLNTKLRKIIVDKTKLSFRELKLDTTNKDRWYTAKESLAKGIVDRILV